MKKTLIAIFFGLSSVAAFSQDEPSAFDSNYTAGSTSNSGSELSFTSKNGHEVLPKAGDWALGIGASSMLRYVGNLFNGNTNNNSPYFDDASKGFSTPTLSIYGKKMVRDDFAYRASISILANNTTYREQVDDDNSSNPDDYLFDKRNYSRYGVQVSGGFEQRRGHGRVQGVYGAEAYVYYLSGMMNKFEYANEITAGNQQPTSYWQNYNPTNVDEPALGYRPTKTVGASSFEGGLRAFVGVEYFIAPQISLGAEFFLGAGYTFSGGESATYEGYDGTAGEVREYTNTTESSMSSIHVGTDNAGGSINMFFYF